ncbi:MAG: GNAT family N-acetyltransferase [Lachnospiraceae bacterium]|nr:GNAT family N-acetyltransferase [Lachnospiraceae bacterium]
MAISLREITKEDSALLLKWANDETVRRNSFHTEQIGEAEHEAWFAKKLADPDCYIYIAEEDGRPVGQIRADIEDGVAEIDYSVDAAERGKGYGSALLSAIERALPAGKITKWSAKVKPENTASLRAFARRGYVVTDKTDAFRELEKTPAKRRIVICTAKSWNVKNAKKLKAYYGDAIDITIWTEKKDLTAENLKEIDPEYVFFPHWSYIIPESVYGAFPCIVFHMTDLPFGRGGSPLQNLIVRGIKETKISAIRVNAGLDTGDIYGKQPLELSGTAGEILRRTSDIIFTKMIPWMILERPAAVPQQGEPVTFKRRKPEDGELKPDMTPETIYDYIRMLDGEGYPNAFMRFGDYVMTFDKAALEGGEVTARVRIRKAEETE